MDELVSLGVPDPAFIFDKAVVKDTAFLRVLLKEQRVEFRDSCKMVRGSLANLASTFGLAMSKGFHMPPLASSFFVRFYPYGLHQTNSELSEYKPVKVYCQGLPPVKYFVDQNLDTKEHVCLKGGTYLIVFRSKR